MTARYLSRDQADALVSLVSGNLIKSSRIGMGYWFPEKHPVRGFFRPMTVTSLEKRGLLHIGNKDTARITARGRKEASEIIAAKLLVAATRNGAL